MAETPDRVGPTALTTTTQTILTAGAAGTWFLVREITITSTASAPYNVTIGLGTSNADSAAKRLCDEITIQPGQTLSLSGFKLVLKGHASTPDLIYALHRSATTPANSANIYIPYVSGP